MNLSSNQPKVIVICGSTGIGKTSTAIRLARKYQGEIIGADSMQIYRLMDIGTAKPTPEEQAQVPHHLIDIIMPDTEFDAVQYAKRARQSIESIHGRGRLPFVVGGTGFYIKALLHGL
ncbi:MAG: tRNA dimethylallyltransferase, partial [Deltaproteobacteria bacterium]|nr:tRNA dimethylallyltransferase [Deltaproteobacteria bacterium]